MNPIWAPWRIPYIESNDAEPGCLFCRVGAASDDENNYIVHRSDRCFVMMNLYPYNSGHLMIVPFQHVGSIEGIDPEIASNLFAIMQMSIVTLRRAMTPDGFNVGINQGKVAGAGIDDHMHIHVVPRWNGDTNFMPVLAGAKVMPELLTATAAKLRAIFAEVEGGQ